MTDIIDAIDIAKTYAPQGKMDPVKAPATAVTAPGCGRTGLEFDMENVTPGLCECGCGQPTAIAKRNYFTQGIHKGRPVRYIASHVGRSRTRLASPVQAQFAADNSQGQADQLELFEQRSSRITKTCTVAGCGEKPVGKGYCSMHWQRHKKTGDPGPAKRFRRIHKGITYSNAHDAVRRLWGVARKYPCVGCGSPAHHWAYDGTDPTQKYGPSASGAGWHLYSIWPEFYMPLCRLCHGRRDGAAAKRQLHEYRLAKYGGATQ